MRAERQKPGLSLKMRAIALLAQRDQSPAELRRKLLRLARQQAESDGAITASAEEASDPAKEVDQLLTWLQAQGYLSEARFVESRVQARAQRWGTQRIRLELAQHGLALSPETEAELKDSEMERARAVWQRKFGGEAATDAAAAAKQARFLAARGFSTAVIRRLLRDPLA